MEEIRVGEYVRINNGKIGKYIQPDLGKPYITNGIPFNEGANYGKHSFNIIDLIEVGDYVNGYRVLEIEDINNCNKKAFTIFKQNEHCYVRLWKTEDIKSIVTKEQFKSVMYEV